MCELEFVGRLGSHPYHYIFTCKTHPHNFFSKEKEITVCDRAAEQKMHLTLGESAAFDSESTPAPKQVI